MNILVVAVFAVCALVSRVHCEDTDWCYHQPSCNDSTWPVTDPLYCSGTRQSPINIVSASAKPNSDLTPFSFKKFRSKSTMKLIENTGSTVKINLGSGVRVSEGDLSEPYECVQFHLHWGNSSSVPGSEHTVDGKRYAMEVHVVCIKSFYKGNLAHALTDSTGLAVLAFLIEEMSGKALGQPASWRTLTSYLSKIPDRGDSVAMAHVISLDDLLVGVDRTEYYRYLGSLTTPNCNEAVVWTVFKDSVKVSRDLIDLFSSTVHFSDSTSPFMANIYRSTQPAQDVTTQPASSSSTSVACYSLGLIALTLALGRN